MNNDAVKHESFWDRLMGREPESDPRIDFSTIADQEFLSRHTNLLHLIDTGFDPFYIGVFLMGTYYRGIWGDKDSASRLGRLLRIGEIYRDPRCEYRLFYGDGTNGIYYAFMQSSHFRDLRIKVENADLKDRRDSSF